MPFRGEVDDVAGMGELARLNHQHLSGLNLMALAGCLINFEVLRKSAFEVKRDSSAHEPHAVHGIDQRFRVCLE
jgi:hypothetical protein